MHAESAVYDETWTARNDGFTFGEVDGYVENGNTVSLSGDLQHSSSNSTSSEDGTRATEIDRRRAGYRRSNQGGDKVDSKVDADRHGLNDCYLTEEIRREITQDTQVASALLGCGK